MSEKATEFGTVWVIGASSGIGANFAQLIAPHARHVAVSARSSDKLVSLSADKPNMTAFPLDVTSTDDVARTASEITARLDGIDMVVVSSGLWWIMPSDELDIQKMRDAMDVNFFGVVNALNAVLPDMKARRSGRIVIVASVAGYRGLPNAGAYGPTKAALMNLAETLELDLQRHGIEITLVNPGFVDTPMTSGNKFPMPGLISADAAAKQLLRGLRRKRFLILFPTVFANAIRALNLLPNWLFFRLVGRLTGSR